MPSQIRQRLGTYLLIIANDSDFVINYTIIQGYKSLNQLECLVSASSIEHGTGAEMLSCLIARLHFAPTSPSLHRVVDH